MMSVHVVGSQGCHSLCLDESFSVSSSRYHADGRSDLERAEVCLFWSESLHATNRLQDVRAIKSEFPSLPVIVISTVADGNATRMAMRHKAWDFVVVPDEIPYLASLLKMIRSLVSRDGGTHSALTPRSVNFPPESALSVQEPPVPLRPVRTALAIAHIDKDYAKKIEVPELASLCAMSQSAFLDMFKKEHGNTTVDYITQFRLEKAKKLLQESSCLIKDVAYQVGYPDEAYFIRVFKENVGVTPKVFQKGFDVGTGGGAES